ncbi:MAG: hypothetical protein H6739_00915 [Alphaproteobacteria bacterium]|nr:hypothetical protein [Alphaproteobacteria bacterium]
MPDTAESLRALLAETRGRRGFPPEVRALATAWMRTEHEAGADWKALGAALGISRTSARNWVRGEAPRRRTKKRRKGGRTRPVEAPGGFLPVAVEPEAPARAAATLITPGGYRVEGLTVDELAALLRVLG